MLHRPRCQKHEPPAFANSQPMGREWPMIRAVVMRRDHFRCVNCGQRGANQVDHIVPRSRGGTDDYDNLRLLCLTCHRAVTSEQGREARNRR